jgi:hypothetical protein
MIVSFGFMSIRVLSYVPSSSPQRPSRGGSARTPSTTSSASQSTSGSYRKRLRKCIALAMWELLHECACQFHSAGKDIISRLLDKEENTRLGSKTGASEVKQHKWFSKINWGLLRNTEPPVSHVLGVVRLATVASRSAPCCVVKLWPWLLRGHMAHFRSFSRLCPIT